MHGSVRVRTYDKNVSFSVLRPSADHCQGNVRGRRSWNDFFCTVLFLLAKKRKIKETINDAENADDGFPSIMEATSHCLAIEREKINIDECYSSIFNYISILPLYTYLMYQSF